MKLYKTLTDRSFKITKHVDINAVLYSNVILRSSNEIIPFIIFLGIVYKQYQGAAANCWVVQIADFFYDNG